MSTIDDDSPVRLDGRHAIVTGGASGIGRATAFALAALGARVVVADVDEAGGARVAEEIGGSFAMLDVGDPVAWERVMRTAGPFDIAFLNAGVATGPGGVDRPEGNPVEVLDDDSYRRIMRVNVDGVVFGARAVLPGMRELGHGDIVATASMAGLHPIAMDPVYGLTKHAVVGFVRSVAAWLDQTPDAPDITVSAICPGFADTNIVSERAREFIAAVGLELMSPDHVASVVVRSLHERVQGAQWVVWPGIDPNVYEWRPAVAPDER